MRRGGEMDDVVGSKMTSKEAYRILAPWRCEFEVDLVGDSGKAMPIDGCKARCHKRAQATE